MEPRSHAAHPVARPAGESFSCSIGAPTGVPEAAVAAARRAVAAGWSESLERHAARVERLERALVDARADLARTTGAELLARLRHAADEARPRLARRNFAADPRGAAAHRAARAEVRKGLDARLESSGVTAKAIQAAAASRFEKLTKVLHAGPATSPPLGTLQGTGPGFHSQTFVTPYHGSDTWVNHWWTEGSATFESHTSHLAGEFGHRSVFECDSASDLDVYSMDCSSCVGVWYTPGVNGRLNVRLKLRCAKAQEHVNACDELGWSDSTSQFHSWWMLSLLPYTSDEDVLYQENWNAVVHADPWDAVSVVDDWYDYHQAVTVEFTTQPVPADVATYIRAGVHAGRFTSLNDITTWQQMRDKWLVDAIEVSDTGAS